MSAFYIVLIKTDADFKMLDSVLRHKITLRSEWCCGLCRYHVKFSRTGLDGKRAQETYDIAARLTGLESDTLR